MTIRTAAWVFMAAVLFTGPALTADPSPAPTPTTAKKAALPRFWKKLGISDEQKVKAYAITGDARSKIAELEAQITAVKAEEHKRLNDILTPEQRSHLAELLTGTPATPVPTLPPADTKKP